LDFLIFFCDPLESQPHDSDIRALLRIAVVWHVLIACNRASTDFIITSPLMTEEYERFVPDYDRESVDVGPALDSDSIDDPVPVLAETTDV
jgi:methylglyoxal synthase